MNKIEEVAQRFKTLNIYDILDDVIKEEREFILNLNREQMLSGNDVNGPLTNQYGYHNPTWDLYETGAFQSAMYIQDLGEYFEIDSKDEKTDMLVERLGEDIFGLSKSNTELLVEYLRPILAKRIKEHLKIK